MAAQGFSTTNLDRESDIPKNEISHLGKITDFKNHHITPEHSKSRKSKFKSDYLIFPKNRYEPHLDLSLADRLVHKGSLFRATLRINKSDPCHEAYATISYLSSNTATSDVFPNDFISPYDDIFIFGPRLRNRAFNGDTVIIKIYPNDVAKNIHTAYKKYKSKSTSPHNNNDDDFANNDPALSFTDTFVELNTDDFIEDPDWKLYGQVVSIVPNPYDHKLFACFYSSQSNDELYHIFSSIDSTAPAFRISHKDFSEFVQKHKINDLTKIVFILKYIVWDIDSMCPTGSIVEFKVIKNKRDSENLLLLYRNSIFNNPFPKYIIDTLPSDTFEIPEAEINSRADLRSQTVFTIDPASAKDLDDALSIHKLPGGNYIVSVHIADVSYFVKPNSKLDNLARQLATTVYLVDYNIPMLPNVLSGNLCSLLPGKDRLTFSVTWNISENGEIMDYWISKSIINSTLKETQPDAIRKKDRMQIS
ncbi:DIS3-like exonuclease 2 [Smittium mucronatum]|uniref:DIS3-like exonuclease 2 n=1 Tax=Smittium mucronatum TaxID=133383 RepID=A0A1R0H565_9FUNG|nr:DIS3-like exonuclease 2 [Smittium mucronatum]